MTSNFFTTLINVGISPEDTQILDVAFSGEPDWLDGLETVAGLLALKQQPTVLPPTGEPWRGIYTTIQAEMAGGADVDAAWRKAIDAITNPDIAIAISNAVNIRQAAILDFEKQKLNKKRYKTKDYLTELKHLGYTFRLNECGNVIEVNDEPISDGLASKIRCQMRDAGYLQVDAVEDSYIAQAYINRYHPVREYLSSLTWDGKPYIRELASYFTDSYGIFELWLRKWLIGACAKVFQAEQNPMLVLDGEQGVGKSEFVKWLASPLPKYFVDGRIDVDDKDTDIRLMSKWIWEVSELGATIRRSDIEGLKAFLTKREVTVRKPYGRHDINGRAMASFIGTVNNTSGVLSDPTGSRRFLITRILSIDWTYTQMMDINCVWSEAMAAYKGGEKWQLAPDERKRALEINEFYEVDDLIEGLLKKYFEIQIGNINWWTATSDILKVLEDPDYGAIKGQTRANSMALAGTMIKLGLKKTKRANARGQRVWGYEGILIAGTP